MKNEKDIRIFLTQRLKSVSKYGIRAEIPAPPMVERYAELYHLRRLLLQLRVDVAIDAGANRGQFARELRDIGFTGWIVSFEPLQTEFQRLSETFQKDRRWKGYMLALGQEEKDVDIQVHSNSVFSSLLDFRTKTHMDGVQNIRMARLNSFAEEIKSLSGKPKARVFLKMDTQGYDLQVFGGASNLLPQIVGLQSELSVQPLYVGMPHYLDALSEYERAGFELVNLATVTRRDDASLQELNCLMQRSGAAT